MASTAGRGAQFEFDFDFAHNGPLLRVEEAAEFLQCSDQHVRNLITEGALLAFPINEYPLPGTPRVGRVAPRAPSPYHPQPERLIYRVLRETVKAQLDPSDAQKWEAIVRHRFLATVADWLFPNHRPDLGIRCVNDALTPKQVGATLAIGGTHVRKLYDAGHLIARDIAETTSAKNKTLRFQRASVIAFVRTRLQTACNLK